jgi:hypothetical protein
MPARVQPPCCSWTAAQHPRQGPGGSSSSSSSADITGVIGKADTCRPGEQLTATAGDHVTHGRQRYTLAKALAAAAAAAARTSLV